jgi:tagatose-6-phosphate ketose/aldose isomerase
MTNSFLPSSMEQAGALTRGEILQQPRLWPTTFDRVSVILKFRHSAMPVVLTGAGTSAYAASAVAAAWPGASAIPTTDLLLDCAGVPAGALTISLARSGDSPESVAVVRKLQRMHPHSAHLAITCNSEGRLAKMAGLDAILLDPRTNDRSLAMTSSFSNLVLAGLLLRHAETFRQALPRLCARVESALPELERQARRLAALKPRRVVILGSAPFRSATREAALKILEMTAGRSVAMPESFLGLRHGPMSFLERDSLTVCLASSDPMRQRYERDVLQELRDKQLGKVAVIATGDSDIPCDYLIPAMAADLDDHLRTPFEIVFFQLLAYHLSLAFGLNPDNPSPDGVINRVVRGVAIHDN